MWYPEDKTELNQLLEFYLKQPDINPEEINGLIVPHAGYEFSGAIAGTAFSLLKNRKTEKAIIIGPSHYTYLNKAVTSNRTEWETPLGKIKLFNSGFPRADIEEEHSIKNQIPFLQKLNIKEVLPLMIGKINFEQAREIAEEISKINALYIFSTDLSHFLPYDNAVEKDKQTIKAIENLNIKQFNKIDACGIYPLLILLYLCKNKDFKPELIEYKNSGDVTGDKSSVVGYASFWF